MKVSSRVWLLVAVVVPCVVVAWLNAWFVWNHFVEGAFLHDSGWYSYIVWRDGVLPKNPVVAEGLPDYYGIHVSPLVSTASVLSYLVPLDRVRWYCLFQASLYAPLAGAAVLLVKERTRLVDAFAVAGTALAFALSGQVVQCVRYPHFEIFVVVGIAFMLAGLATGRSKLAWAGLFVAAATREDGGFHAAFFCAAVVASDLSGRPFPVRRKTVITMFVVATLASVLAFVFQKTFFQTANLFRREYLGEPAYAHLTAAEVWRRTKLFFDRSAFIAFPMMGTFAVAFIRRDRRYLLGWAVELPWFLLNLFAHQEAKFQFTIYTGFPFIGSFFWVGAYAFVARRDDESPRSPLAALATISLLSTCGIFFSDAGGLPTVLRVGIGPVQTPRRPIEAVAEALRRDPDVYGRVAIDPSVSAWSLESAKPSQSFFHTWQIASFDDKDGTIFYATGAWRGRLQWFLARSPFEKCGHPRDTPLYMCARKDHPLPAGFVEDSPLTQALIPTPQAIHVHDGFNVDAHPHGALAVYGPFMTLPKGTYTVTWHFRWGVCLQTPNARGGLDVISGPHLLAGHRMEEPEATVALQFSLAAETNDIELRAWAGRCAYAIDRVDFGAAEVPPMESAP